MTISSSSQYVFTTANNDVIYKLGVGILKEHLDTYYKYILIGTTSRYVARTVSSSLAFVQGSGLDMVIQYFGIDANPEDFRERFIQWCAWQKRHQDPK